MTIFVPNFGSLGIRTISFAGAPARTNRWTSALTNCPRNTELQYVPEQCHRDETLDVMHFNDDWIIGVAQRCLLSYYILLQRFVLRATQAVCTATDLDRTVAFLRHRSRIHPGCCRSCLAACGELSTYEGKLILCGDSIHKPEKPPDAHCACGR